MFLPRTEAAPESVASVRMVAGAPPGRPHVVLTSPCGTPREVGPQGGMMSPATPEKETETQPCFVLFCFFKRRAVGKHGAGPVFGLCEVIFLVSADLHAKA